jgi:hypothetical protein
MEKVKTIDFKMWFGTAVIIAGCYGMFVLLRQRETDSKIAEEKRKDIVCPSLLSIGRSSRDTLIIMKNEYLCNSFVLDNLK